MQRCESSQVELSSLLDGEVDASALAEALDHAMRCPHCRESYAAFRALDRGLERSERVVPPPRRLPWTHLRPLALAACTLLGLNWAWSSGSSRPDAPATQAVEVRLGGHPESMDDARFVEMAVELLQADPRYAHSMQQLLRQVRANHELPFESRFAESGSLDAENHSITRLYH